VRSVWERGLRESSSTAAHNGPTKHSYSHRAQISNWGSPPGVLETRFPGSTQQRPLPPTDDFAVDDGLASEGAIRRRIAQGRAVAGGAASSHLERQRPIACQLDHPIKLALIKALPIRRQNLLETLGEFGDHGSSCGRVLRDHPLCDSREAPGDLLAEPRVYARPLLSGSKDRVVDGRGLFLECSRHHPRNVLGRWRPARPATFISHFKVGVPIGVPIRTHLTLRERTSEQQLRARTHCVRP
jgi:hypothetical protein